MKLARLTSVLLLATSSTAGAVAAGNNHKNDKMAPPPCAAVASIGAAHMDEAGVITLRIRSLPPGPIAEGELRYAPGEPHYANIRRHLGSIKPGEYKSLHPWC